MGGGLLSCTWKDRLQLKNLNATIMQVSEGLQIGLSRSFHLRSLRGFHFLRTFLSISSLSFFMLAVCCFQNSNFH